MIGCIWPLVAMAVRDEARRGGIHCYDVVASPDDLVERVGRERPDLCLLVAPLGTDLSALITRLAAASRSTKTVVLAADESPPLEVLQALRAGAHGWLPLGADSSRLATALRAVSEGEAAVPRSLMATVLAELRGTPTRQVALPSGVVRELSPREHDVLSGHAEGLTTAQIASRLGVGEATVRGYVASAVKRLGVRDRTAAVRLLHST